MKADGTFPGTANTSLEIENSTETIRYLPYTDQKLGISFEYPSSWTLDEKKIDSIQVLRPWFMTV